MIYYATTVTAIGGEAVDLLEGGVAVLYQDGAPEALAEISIQHRVDGGNFDAAPPVGARIRIGDAAAPLSVRITAVGTTAWSKVREMGHVVLSFNGAPSAERPGEICVEHVEADALSRALVAGARLTIAD